MPVRSAASDEARLRHGRYGADGPLTDGAAELMVLQRAARRLTGFAPLLLGATPRTVPAAAGTVARWGAASVGAALAPPVALDRKATAASHHRPARRVWSVDGRAQIGVLGLDGSAAD